VKKVLVFGETNPSPAKKGKNMAKKKKGASKTKAHSTSHHKKGKGKGEGPKDKGHRNPGLMGKASEGAMKVLKRGLAFGLGALGTKILSQTFVPTSVRAGSWSPLATAAVGVVGAVVLDHVPVVNKYALEIGAGGVGLGLYEGVSPTVLPMLQFNLLGETPYLGEIDSRAVLTLGEIDQRRTAALARSGLGELGHRGGRIASRPLHHSAPIQATGLPG